MHSKHHSHGGRARRRGIVAVLAMLYVMLFTVLAVGFYAASTLSVQTAANDRSAADAQAAAESGLQFAQYELENLSLPPAGEDEDLLEIIAHSLGGALDGSGNMNGHSIAITHNVIYLPSLDDAIRYDPVSPVKFQVQVSTHDAAVWTKVIGTGNNPAIRRAIQIRFQQVQRGDARKLIAVPASYEEVTP